MGVRLPRKPAKLAAPAAGVTLTAVVPVRTQSALNLREHYMARSRRVKAERTATAIALLAGFGLGGREVVRHFPGPVRVTLTRLGGRKLDRHDGLPAAMKGVVDEVCAWLSIDDGDPRLTVCYDASPGGPWGVRVVVAVGGV